MKGNNTTKNESQKNEVLQLSYKNFCCKAYVNHTQVDKFVQTAQFLE